MCKAVRNSEVTEMLDKGACSVEEISRSCGAGTDCGSCLKRLQKVVDEHQKARMDAEDLVHQLNTPKAV